MNGFVCVLTCDDAPALLKVAVTSRTPWERAEELSSANGAHRFSLARAFPVRFAAEADELVQRTLESWRLRPDGDLYGCTAPVALAAIEGLLRNRNLLDPALCVDTPESHALVSRYADVLAADGPDGPLARLRAELDQARAELQQLAVARAQLEEGEALARTQARTIEALQAELKATRAALPSRENDGEDEAREALLVQLGEIVRRLQDGQTGARRS